MATIRFSQEVWGGVLEDGGVVDVHDQVCSGVLVERRGDLPFFKELGLEEWFVSKGLEGSLEGSNVVLEVGHAVEGLLKAYKGDWKRVGEWLRSEQKCFKGAVPLELLLTPLGQTYVRTGVERMA